MRLKLLSFFLLVSCTAISQTYYLFIGTYTNAGSKGIYTYTFDASTGKAEWVSTTEGIVNPSYLAIAPNRKTLFAVTETARENAGSVSAFSFDQVNGKLTFLNKQPSGGDNPCYVTVSKNNKWVFIANYSGGSLSAFPVNADGSIQPYSQSIQHTGTGFDKKRQEKPHVHSTVISPSQDYLFTPDLGMDKVFIYKINQSSQKPLVPAKQPFVMSKPGSGPRHFAFHPNNRYAYLIEEMSGSVVAYKYKNGTLTSIQSIATHPADFKGVIGSADIHISNDGKFLYASNRGDENTVTVFSINTETGKLTLAGIQPTMGKTPRNFIIDPSGKYLLVANQQSNNIVIFKRDLRSGLLKETGEEIKVPTPVCLQMMEK
ncbi:MAG: lactonase family protein [Chitinophagaceae bacterium]